MPITKTVIKTSTGDRKIKNQIIPLENLTMEDINFPEFCFGIIGKIPFKDQPDELTFVDKINPDAKITIVKSKHGLPTQFTRDLRLALIKLAMKKNNFSTELTEATASEILREMGLVDSGGNFKLLRKHMDILVNTRIKFFNSYFDKVQSKSINSELDFSILQGYLITEQKSSKASDGFKGYFLWQKFFYENSVKNAKNLIDLDYSTYTELKGDITKQLYSFLNKRSFGKVEFRIALDVLAYTKLGISTERSLSKLRFDLKKAHLNLLNIGFLSKTPEFIKTRDKQEHIVYSFSDKYTEKLTHDSIFPEDPHSVTLKQELNNLGFTTDGQIGRILKEYSQKQVKDAIDLYKFESQKTKILDPKKWVFACLKRGFDMTSLDQSREAELKQKEEELLNQQKAEELAEFKRRAELSSELKKDTVDQWILENTSQYFSKCGELYKELVDSKKTFFIKLIEKHTISSGKTPAEVIMENSILSSMVRERIAQSIID